MKKYRDEDGYSVSSGYSLSSAYGSINKSSVGKSHNMNSLKKLSELEKLQLLQLQRTREQITRELEHVSQSSSSMYPYHNTGNSGSGGYISHGYGSSNYDNNSVSNRSMMTSKVSFFDDESIHSFKSVDIPSSNNSNMHSKSSRSSRNNSRQQISSTSPSPSRKYKVDDSRIILSQSVNSIKSGKPCKQLNIYHVICTSYYSSHHTSCIISCIMLIYNTHIIRY